MTPPNTPLPADRFHLDLATRAVYSEGAGILRIVPAAVARPRTVTDIVDLMVWASRVGAPLVARGAGSGMGGGNVGDGVIVDLQSFDRSTQVDPIAMTARTGASTTVHELNAAAVGHGLRMPAVPSSGAFATAGGVVATNASGALSCRYGSVRQWVTGATLITGDGEVVALDRGRSLPEGSALASRWRVVAPAIAEAHKLVAARFPRTRKNSAGYAFDAYLASGDLLDLVIGSEGTLGLITEVRWRLQPIPTHRRTVRLALRDLDDLGEVVLRLQGCEPSAVELLDQTLLSFIATVVGDSALAGFVGAQSVLLVEFEGEDGPWLDAVAARALSLTEPYSLMAWIAASEEERSGLWQVRHLASPILAGLGDGRRSLQVIEDGAVPLEQLAAYVRGVRTITARHGVDAVLFGHAGDGHVHVNLLPYVDRLGWVEAVRAIYDEVGDLVLRLGGTPSGEHGDGRLRVTLVEQLYGPELVELFRRVRGAFDPAGTLNPGVITGPTAVWDRLKVGASAEAIPSDAAEALQIVERTGGYGVRRHELVRRSSPDARPRSPDSH